MSQRRLCQHIDARAKALERHRSCQAFAWQERLNLLIMSNNLLTICLTICCYAKTMLGVSMEFVRLLSPLTLALA